MERLIKILQEIRPDVDFSKEDQLIDGSILDSMDIVAIANELNDVFGVEIDVEDLEAENFNSAKAMWDLVESLK